MLCKLCPAFQYQSLIWGNETAHLQITCNVENLCKYDLQKSTAEEVPVQETGLCPKEEFNNFSCCFAGSTYRKQMTTGCTSQVESMISRYKDMVHGRLNPCMYQNVSLLLRSANSWGGFINKNICIRTTGQSAALKARKKQRTSAHKARH